MRVSSTVAGQQHASSDAKAGTCFRVCVALCAGSKGARATNGPKCAANDEELAQQRLFALEHRQLGRNAGGLVRAALEKESAKQGGEWARRVLEVRQADDQLTTWQRTQLQEARNAAISAGHPPKDDAKAVAYWEQRLETARSASRSVPLA